MSAITVSRLHKMLGAMIAAGHGRKPVCISKETFTHPCEEDGTTILNVIEVTGPEWIPQADDDGGAKWNKDGTQSGKVCVVLVGDGYDPAAA